MRITRDLFTATGLALVLGAATLLTMSGPMPSAAAAATAASSEAAGVQSRARPPARASAARQPSKRASSARESSTREVEQLRTLSQVRPTIDLFVRGLNRGDALEISAAFLEIGTLEPGTGRPVHGRSAIRSYYEARGKRAGNPLAARIDEAVIGADRASIQATLLPRDGKPKQPARATFVLRRSAPTDWHIERATLVAALTPR